MIASQGGSFYPSLTASSDANQPNLDPTAVSTNNVAGLAAIIGGGTTFSTQTAANPIGVAPLSLDVEPGPRIVDMVFGPDVNLFKQPVIVREDGNYEQEGRKLSLAELRGQIASLKPGVSNAVLNIRAHPKAPLKAVVDLTKLCEEFGVKASIQPHGSPASDISTNLHTRTFKVDPNTFWVGIESFESTADLRHQASTSNSPPARIVNETVRAFFTSIGVDLQPPKSIYFKDRNGMILVRATLKDLDTIEQAIQVLNSRPPQVNIRAKFVEVPIDMVSTVLADASVKTNQNGDQTATLTETQARTIIKALEQTKDVHIVSCPEVTTLSGRQAQVQVVNIKTIVTGMNSVLTNGFVTMLPQTTNLPVGPTLDVTPYVSADGSNINMTIIPTVTEFLGYDDPGPGVGAAVPIPRFRVRQVEVVGGATLLDGQTIVIGGFVSESVWHKPGGIKSTKVSPELDKRMQLLVFITPTIVNEAGNRVHTDDQLPFARDAVPKQQPGK